MRDLNQPGQYAEKRGSRTIRMMAKHIMLPYTGFETMSMFPTEWKDMEAYGGGNIM
jgi:hypothetical protein